MKPKPNAIKPPPLQFTLTALLALTVATASAMSLFGPTIGLWVVIACMTVLFTWDRVKTHLERVVVVGILLILGALLMPGIETGHSQIYADTCRNRLQAVAKAIQAYHADHGQFPPACVRDETGRPMHSWRVLILPYLGYQDLYNAYRFDEPWDGPNNSTLLVNQQTLLSSIPKEYECRGMFGRLGGGGVTTCVAVVGSETMWSDDRPMRENNLRDGAGQTIMLGEVDDELAIPWLEPRDLAFEQAASGIWRNRSSPGGWRPDPPDQFIAVHPSPFNREEDTLATHVVTADGKVWALPENTTPKKLRALLTASGAESVDIDSLVAKRPSTGGKIINAILLFVSLSILIASVIRRRRQLAALCKEELTPSPDEEPPLPHSP